MCAIPLSMDLKEAVGEPKLLFHASDVSWKKPVCHANGIEGYVTDGPFFWRTQNGTLLCLWVSFSEHGYTQAVAMSDNGEIDGNFIQLEPLFWKDGGHGMIFRALDGTLYLSLHSPNRTPEERPAFFRLEERPDGFSIVK